jgi:hypothetical protein
MAEVVALADYSVEIEGEKFNICNVPDEKSKLVEAKKKVVLNNLNLNELISGLKRSGNLLFLAYNGVAGFGELRAGTNALQDKLGKLCTDSELALDRFARRTATILDKLQRNFRYLTEGKEATALAFLKQCADTANQMATEASDLAIRFDKLADETMVLCGKTEIQQGKTDEEKRKLEQDVADLKGKAANAKKLSEELAVLRTKLQKLYDEAKSKADTAAERGFALSMVSAIMGPIAQGLGTFASVATGAGAMGALRGATSATSAPNTPPPAPAPSSPEKTAAEKKVEEANTAKKAAETELETAKKDLQTKESEKNTAIQTAAKKANDETLAKERAQTEQEKLDKDPTNSKLKEAAQTAKTAAETATKDKEEAEKDKKKKEDAAVAAKKTLEEKQAAMATAVAAITAAGRTLETAASNLATAGAGMMDLAQTYETEKEKYLNKLLEYQEQETTALANMAEYAVRMTSVTSDVEVHKTVSQSLCQAIAAFNAVAQVLRNAALFWTQMADACKALASEGVQSTVKAFSELPPADRLEMWKDESFKREAVDYMAQWKALELICRDYSKAAGETREEVQANIIRSPTPEESMRLTPELAKTLLLDASRSKATAEAKGAAIKNEIKPKEQKAA